jgi:HEAT repeat protein
MKSNLKEAFLAGLSGDSQKMRESHEYLTSLKSSPNLIQSCIEISLTDDSLELRQLSSIFLKNLTKTWKDSKRDFVLPSPDKDFLKSNILSLLLFSIPDKIRAQFSEIAFNICKSDFPWDLLLNQIDQGLNSTDLDQIFASLTMIGQIARVYEHKINDRRDNLKILVVRYFKRMRILLRTLLNEKDEERFRFIALVLQIYWTCFYADLPEEQANVENLQDWLGMCREVLLLDMNGLDVVLDNELQMRALEEHPKWVCKKWSSQILHRFFNKYFNTLYLRDHHKFIGEYFQSTWAIPLSLEILSLLLSTTSKFLPSTVTNYLLKFLIQAVRLQVTFERLQPSGQKIISDLILPNLKRTSEDETLYKTDPVEFIRKETDLSKAYFSSKASAAELLKSLCEKNHLEYFMNYLTTHLTTENLLLKESLMYALGVLNKVIKTSKIFLLQIEPILNNFAFQELLSPVGMLRSRACWLYSCFADLPFKDLEKQEVVLGCICRLMVDEELPVRIEAATALPKFFNWPKAKSKLADEIKQVLQIYIDLINLIDYEELIEALEDLVSHFSSEVRPFALDLSKCLVSAFVSMSAREADDSIVAAESLLNTLGKLIDVLDDDFESLIKISYEVVPMIDLVLSSKDLNFFDPTLSILSSLLYYCPIGSLPHFSKYALGLYNYVIENGKVKDFVKDNLEDIFSPFGNFLQKYKNFSCENIDLFISFATIMINDGYIQLSIGCKVFSAIIENMNGEPLIITKVLINSYPVFTSNDAKKIKALFVQIVLTCLWKNCEFTLDYMKKILCFDSVFKFIIDNHMIFKEEIQILQAILGILATLNGKNLEFGYFKEILKVFIGLWKRLQNIRCPGSFEDLGNLDFDRDDEDFEGDAREMYESVLERINVEQVVKGVLGNIAGVIEGAGIDEDDRHALMLIMS